MTATLDQIQAMLDSGELASANSNIEEYLSRNLDDPKALKIYRKIQKQIYQNNLKKVKEGIRIAESMWDQKRYEDLLNLYLKLQPYAPNYKPLQRLIDKVYKVQGKSVQKKEDTAMSDFNTTLTQYIQTKNFDRALDFLQEAIKKDPDNPGFQKTLLDLKRKIIDHKLTTNKSKFKKASPPDIYDFIKSLYEFEPTYYKTQQLLVDQHEKLKYYYANKKDLFVKDAKRQIRILYNKKEFEKALQAVNELQKIDPSNSLAKRYRKKIKPAIDNRNFKLAYEVLKSKDKNQNKGNYNSSSTTSAADSSASASTSSAASA